MEQLFIFVKVFPQASIENPSRITRLLEDGWIIKQISAGANGSHTGCYVLLEREKTGTPPITQNEPEEV